MAADPVVLFLGRARPYLELRLKTQPGIEMIAEEARGGGTTKSS